MFSRRSLLAGLVLVAVLLVASPAFAAAPTVNPETFVGPVTFESTSSPLQISPIVLGEITDSTGWWGPVTNLAHAGGKSLWVAGNRPAGPVTTASGAYPYGAHGTVTLDASQTTLSAYSSMLTMWYYMPSLGGGDLNYFNFAWWPSGNIASSTPYYNFPIVSGWTRADFNLSNPSSPANLSRRGGNIEWRFVDQEDPIFTATNGLGPLLDDISLTGYTYGPARVDPGNAATLSTPGGVYTVSLAWSRPASSTADARDDTRPKRYRIWRDDPLSATAAAVVGEVDDPGTGALSFVDHPSTYTQDWRYHIQAINPGAGAPTHWGTLSDPILVTKQVVPTTTFSTSPSTPSSSGWYQTLTTFALSADVNPSTKYYSIDSLAGPYQPYIGPVSIDQGRHTVYYYSKNQLGLAETTQSAPIRIDYTAPNKPVPTASDVSWTSASLTWPAVADPGSAAASGVSEYRIYNSAGTLIGTIAAGDTPPATYTYPLSGLTAGTSYTFKVVAVDAAGNVSSTPSAANQVSVQTKDPVKTEVGASVPANRIVAYNGPTIVAADLSFSGGIPLSGQASKLKVYRTTAGPTAPLSSWSPTSDTFAEAGVLGHYIATIHTTTKTWYQVRFVGSGQYASSNSTSTMLVQSKAALTSPAVPRTAYRSRYTTVYDRMYPKHYEYKSTRIYFEHYEAYKGKYMWRTKFYKIASQKSGPSYMTCSAAVKFPYTGKWRVQVRHADASHYVSYSSKSSIITVR
jgi:Fibronectin type III domain